MLLSTIALLLIIGPSRLVPDATAQEARTVVISDGRVSINGKYLSDDAVPKALRDFDGQVSFTFLGEEDPVLGFGEQLYRIEGERIVEVPASALGIGSDVRVRRLHPGGVVHVRTFPRFDSEAFSFEMPDFEFQMFDSLRLMSDSVAAFLGSRVAQEHASRMRALADEMRRSIPPPGGRVHVFSGPDWDSHASDLLGARDRFRHHLELENELDEESRRIAEELRLSDSSELRKELEEDLREHLEEIFELRQENRRAEVRELESRLEELRNRLQRREELRDRIIEERMEFLLGEETRER